jgi:tetratricopeptide (TPR) repeat protein
LKKQLVFAGAALAIVIGLFFLGRREPLKSTTVTTEKPTTASFNIVEFIATSKQKLTPSQATYLAKLENGITRGDLPTQQINAYKSLANFWKDSLQLFEPYAFYTAEASKLDNSEKNLTFAAQLFLSNIRGEENEAKVNWETEQAIGLFEKALQLNPTNDSLKVGLGSCYVFGKGRFGGPAETMKGIQQLLEVVRKDSTNMKAQLVLGIGGFVSGQYDKAIDRLQKVIKAEPTNLEAIAFLADAYAAKGDKQEAIKWYQLSKRMANNAHYSKEVDDRIKQLQ